MSLDVGHSEMSSIDWHEGSAAQLLVDVIESFRHFYGELKFKTAIGSVDNSWGNFVTNYCQN